MMMMGARGGGGGGGGGAGVAGRYPFTATQWQELEHQALIYKCLASGKPIPSYLMPPLRRILDSALATSPSLAFPPQPSLGWGCFGGMGFGGRKADEDPEPGRCRRTDGKKWRCSKEAYPDSKYCEKHMHRGKNRSRKPVEMSLATPASNSSPSTAAAISSSPAPSYHRQPAVAAHEAAASPYQHAMYAGGGHGYATPARSQYHQGQQVSPFQLHLDTTHRLPPVASYVSSPAAGDQRDYAYGHAVAKEGVGEHAFFSDGDRDRHHHHHQQQQQPQQWQFEQLGGTEQRQAASSLFSDGGGYGSNNGGAPPYGNSNGGGSPYGGVDLGVKAEDEAEERRRQQHCFVLGADLRLERPSAGHDDAAAAAAQAQAQQKPLRPFFDEWPHEKSRKGSWMGLDGETQLSISIPMTANDLPIASRYHD